MRFATVCSGIDAATLAWKPLGWEPAFYSEIAAFPRAVLKHHYPDIPLHGDFTTIKGDEYGPVDLLAGGTPCQDFSVAGKRAGMDGARGNLSLEFIHLVERIRPRWVVWENVPGLLSIDGGRAFGAFLGALGKCGYGFAYRILDAQYFGVPQRRRRIVLVAYLGDWRPPAAVLFERESLRGDITPRREAGAGVAALTSNGVGTCGVDDNQGQAGHLIAHTLRAEGFDASEDGSGRGVPLVPDVAWALQERDSKGCDSKGCDSSTKDGHLIPIAFDCKASGQHGFSIGDTSPTLRSMASSSSHPNGGGQVAVAIQERAVCEKPDAGPDGKGFRDDDLSYTLEARTVPQAVAFQCHGGSVGEMGTLRAGNGNETGGVPFVMNLRGREGGAVPEMDDLASMRASSGGSSRSYVADYAVRRLTPVECERLMGMPDNYTRIQWRKKPAEQCPDGPRYAAIGNSWAVPVFRWVGERINAFEGMAV